MFEGMMAEDGVNLAQNSVQCKVKVEAWKFDSKKYHGQTNVITLTWTRSTRSIQVSAPAAMLDHLVEQVKDLTISYYSMLYSANVTPPPTGTEEITNGFRDPAWSQYMEDNAKEKVSKDEVDCPRQAKCVPKGSKYSAAIHQIAQQTNELLVNYPEWADKLVRILISEFGAEPGHLYRDESQTSDDFEMTEESMKTKGKAAGKNVRSAASASTAGGTDQKKRPSGRSGGSA